MAFIFPIRWSCPMAMNIYFFCKLDGADAVGEPSTAEIGGEDVSQSIECFSYKDSVATARSAATGKYTNEGVTITKRIDKSSPLLMRALTSNQVVEGELRFYRPNDSSGVTERFFTITFTNGRVAGIQREMEDTQNPALANRPPLETITFVSERASWTADVGGTSHEVDWKQQI